MRLALFALVCTACSGPPTPDAETTAAVTLPQKVHPCAVAPSPPGCSMACNCPSGYVENAGECWIESCVGLRCGKVDCDYDCVKVGAWVDPKQATGPQSIDELECDVGRTLDLSLHYEGFDVSASQFAGDTDDDAANGRTPIVSLGCIQPADRADEVDTILALAQAYAAFHGTVIVRYCWEMNIAKGGSGPPRGGTPDQFKSDWNVLTSWFTFLGVTNVKWFFCPSRDGGLDWYPGDDQVDYAGWDAYDDNGDGFVANMSGPYNTYSGINRPFIVGETGSLQGNQQSYLEEAAATLGSQFPRIIGIDYFDAHSKPDKDWTFDAQGLKAFVDFAQYE